MRPAFARVATANAHTSVQQSVMFISHGCAVASAGDDDHQQLHFKIMLASVVCVLVQCAFEYFVRRRLRVNACRDLHVYAAVMYWYCAMFPAAT